MTAKGSLLSVCKGKRALLEAPLYSFNMEFLTLSTRHCTRRRGEK